MSILAQLRRINYAGSPDTNTYKGSLITSGMISLLTEVCGTNRDPTKNTFPDQQLAFQVLLQTVIILFSTIPYIKGIWTVSTSNVLLSFCFAPP